MTFAVRSPLSMAPSAIWKTSNCTKTLSGTLPSEYGSLSNLQDLELHNNNLRGTLPSEYSSLSNLEYLWLHENSLSGTVPSELISLSKLQYLWLDGTMGDYDFQGGAGENTIHGDDGSDRLYGNGGNDILYGGPGDDLLNGVRETTRFTETRVRILLSWPGAWARIPSTTLRRARTKSS